MRGCVTFEGSRRYELPPETLWPFVADTARMNEIVGFAAYKVREEPDADGRIVRRARGKAGPLAATWTERFGQWTAPSRLDQVRTFDAGPLSEVRTIISLDRDGAGTRVTVRGEVDWRGLLGAAGAGIGAYRREFSRRLAAVERLAALAAAAARPGPEPVEEAEEIEPRARQRLATVEATLAADPAAHGLAASLVGYLTRAGATELHGIRPLALARRWGAAEDDVIELCLAAHGAGLLSLGWDLLCPRCRGAKSRVARLDELPTGAHCPSCNVDYDRDFPYNVELTFRPEPWLRDLPDGEFCMLGAASTPHVRFQREVAAGAAAEFEVGFPPGRYRYRTVEPGGSAEIEIGADGSLPGLVVGPGGEVTAGPPGAPGRLRVENGAGAPRLAVVEDRAWVADALTGDRVIAMPAFRRLCPEQLLRAGDDAAIRRISILFTDLTGSTAMYVRMGDAPAYGLVRAHFAYLAERIARHRGFIVKTVGDAVMAAFHDPADAVRAALSMQDDLPGFNAARRDGKIVLKLGLHQGPCVAVTTAGVLDYFGSTVNTAARLEHHCRGGEIVISAAVLADPDAAAAIAGRAQTAEQAELRGLTEPVRCVRIGAGKAASPTSPG